MEANNTKDQETKVHPFERTLGPGPYTFVGFFEINIAAGQMGRSYVDESKVHKNFKTGAGTCAHCGHAILNVYQIQIGNGDVFGVGSDCIEKVELPARTLSAIQKVQNQKAKEQRQARKAKKGNAAREKLKALIASNGAELAALPHPSRPNANLKDYAEWIVKYSSDGGIVIAVKKIEKYLEESRK